MLQGRCTHFQHIFWPITDIVMFSNHPRCWMCVNNSNVWSLVRTWMLIIINTSIMWEQAWMKSLLAYILLPTFRWRVLEHGWVTHIQPCLLNGDSSHFWHLQTPQLVAVIFGTRAIKTCNHLHLYPICREHHKPLPSFQGLTTFSLTCIPLKQWCNLPWGDPHQFKTAVDQIIWQMYIKYPWGISKMFKWVPARDTKQLTLNCSSCGNDMWIIYTHLLQALRLEPPVNHKADKALLHVGKAYIVTYHFYQSITSL